MPSGRNLGSIKCSVLANPALSAAKVMLRKLVLRALCLARVRQRLARLYRRGFTQTNGVIGIHPRAGAFESFIHPLCSPAPPGPRERRHKRLDHLAVLFRRRFALACPASPMRIPDTDMDGDRGGLQKRNLPSSKPHREAQRIWGVNGRICSSPLMLANAAALVKGHH